MHLQPEINEIAFDSRGTRCAAWHLSAGSDALQRPEGRPCVVMAHGMMGTRDSGLLPYARAFTDAGLDVLLFDFRYLGTSLGQPRQLVSFSAQHHDYGAAVGCARGLAGVDPARIVLWGTSYSGGHVIAHAAADAQIAAAIAQVPGVDALAGVRAILAQAGMLGLARLTAHGLRDLAGAALGQEAHRIPVFGPPGSLALSTSPDGEPGFAAIAGPSYRNEACARIVLTSAVYRPIRQASRVRCPLLIQIAERDAVVPTGPAKQVASSTAGPAELCSYPIEHFDIYLGKWRERAIVDQLDFVRRHLT